jgi:hypothetical protein
VAAGRRARRHHRFRLAVAAPMLGGSVGAVVVAALVWASETLGLDRVTAAGWPVAGWPVLSGGLLLALGAAAMWPRRDPDRWARGAAGEVATAEVLGQLSPHRWVVLHDLALPGSRANVDHLVIGPTGVWVVDSKAYRARLEVRWGRVMVGGAPLSTAAVRWEAQVVSNLLGAPTRSVIAVHGRGLPRRGRRYQGVRVLPATRLLRRLQRGRRWWPALDQRRVRELGELAAARFS